MAFGLACGLGWQSVLMQAKCTNASEEVAETVLAHKVGSKIVRAYRRTDHFEERAILMERWAQHVTGAENVFQLAK